MEKLNAQRMTTLRPQPTTTRWTDYLPFVPMALCVAVVFNLPGPSDRQAVAEVQAGLTSAVNGIMQFAGVREVAAPAPAYRVSSTSPRPASDIRPSNVRQQWENRPSTADYSSGRSTRLSFGSAERGSVLRGR